MINFCRGAIFFWVYIGWDTAAIITDTNGVIRVDSDVYFVAVSSQRLVNRIVDRLKNHVMQAGTVVSVANVHAGAFAHRFPSRAAL